jgi:serine/tyrosine/threonine adenylyltransferase
MRAAPRLSLLWACRLSLRPQSEPIPSAQPSASESVARQQLSQEPQDGTTRQADMRAINPAFIPRNHRVEAVIAAVVERDDFAQFEELLTVLLKPYEDQRALAHDTNPPQPHERVHQKFCGT